MKRVIIATALLLVMGSCQKRKECSTANTNKDLAYERLSDAQEAYANHPGIEEAAEVDRAQGEFNEAKKHRDGVCGN